MQHIPSHSDGIYCVCAYLFELRQMIKGNWKFKKSEIGVFNTKNSDAVFRGFEHGMRIVGLTRGEFSLIDLIHSALKHVGQAHVIVVTWSAGIKDAHQIEWMLNTDLIRTFKVITDHSYVNRQKKYAVALDSLFGSENIRTSEIHAKFTLIHNEDWNLCIRHSMNLNANKTCESFEIDDDLSIFQFYMDFIEHTFGDMPKGFVSSSYKVNKSLDKYFNSRSTALKGWSEI